jgi:hypothetical protein
LVFATPFAVVFTAMPLVPALAALVAPLWCWVPDPALAFVPALLGVFAFEAVEFATGVVAPLVASFVPVAEAELEFPLHAPDPSAGAEVCWAEVCCGGALVAGVGILADADVLASSQAAKGVSSLPSPDADGCKRGDDVSETAAAMSDVTLGILGTGELPEAT